MHRASGAMRWARDQRDRAEEKPKRIAKSRCVSAHETRPCRPSYCPRLPSRPRTRLTSHEHIFNSEPRPVPCLWLRPCNGVRFPGGGPGFLPLHGRSRRAWPRLEPSAHSLAPCNPCPDGLSVGGLATSPAPAPRAHAQWLTHHAFLPLWQAWCTGV